MNLSKLSFFALMLSLLMISCTEGVVNTTEDLTLTDEELAEGQINDMCASSCFDLVFPLSMNFPDGTTATFDDVDTMRSSLLEWRRANIGEYETWPELVYPISVILDDETESEIASAEEFKALIAECKPFGRKGKRAGKGIKDKIRDKISLDSCFTFVYPISFAFPDGSEVAYDSGSEVLEGLKAWKETAGEDEEGQPELVYPISVTLADGTVQELASAEEIKALRETCRPDRR
ncbi:hypothetical protein [Membranihabitans marinus]|uniref:hypothetical protein n=1 Tax=Membranihabitans marinus TaxID=1227546 RepID=UPI001F1693E5|nr:hypothetical protein [Membranihabitans marinus]